MRERAWLVCLLLFVAARADAQTFTVGGGSVSLWDDETFLGQGLMVSGGVGAPLGSHLVAEAELSVASHHRDAGALAADGTPIVATGRLAYRFNAPTDRVRPFVSAGLALIHSTGHFTTQTFVPDSRGFPVPAPPITRDWSVTQQAFEIGGGASIKAGPRFALRPEARWTGTGSSGGDGVLGPPIWILRAGVTLEWTIR